MIALILGGAPSVFAEAEEAAALLNRRHIVVAANLAGIEWLGRLDCHVTLHPDHLAGWRFKRKGPVAGRFFTPGGPDAPKWADVAAERWPGSSGLYALQCALFEMGATAAILCGVPMDTEAGHFSAPGQWAGTADYRQAFEAALLVIGGRTRSMSGWTRQLLGDPTPEWIGAVDNIAPLGATRSTNQRTQEMHKVTNRGEGTQSFWARNPNGTDKRVHLQPGETGEFEIHASDPIFGGDLRVEAVTAAAEVAPPEPHPTKPATARRV